MRSIAALDEARVRGLVILIEEPELYLSPPAQRHLHRLLRKLSARGRNQVLYSTHAPVFLGVDRLDELVLVRHDERTGTTAAAAGGAVAEADLPACVAEFDAERAEIFLSRAVLFVEGRTEKLAFPFVFEALGFDADQEAIAIVDCAGKGNMPLFAEICNACGIPYVVVHDRDAPRGEQPAEAEQIANETILRVAGEAALVMLVPDFEGVTGLSARRGQAGRRLEALPERRRRRARARCGRRSNASSRRRGAPRGRPAAHRGS